jgi:AdoMet-dependent heme synthase
MTWYQIARNTFAKPLIVFKKSMGMQSRLAIQFDITNACNLKCKHCYLPNHNNQGAIGMEDWNKIFDQYVQLLNTLGLTPSIILCGGEPTLSPNFIPMLELIEKKFGNAPITVLSNGTLLNVKALMEHFPQIKPVFQISLDGPDAASHDFIRGNGSFDKSIKTIRELIANGFQVESLAVLSHRTNSRLQDFFLLAKELKLSSMNFTRLIKMGHAQMLTSAGEDRPLNALELKLAYEDILSLSRKHSVRTNTEKPLYGLIESTIGGSGRWGYQGLVVDYRGNLKVSSRVDIRLGSLLKEDLSELFFNHPLLKNLRAGKIQKCGDCSLRSVCGGDRNAAYAESGNFLGADPGCWKDLDNNMKEVV